MSERQRTRPETPSVAGEAVTLPRWRPGRDTSFLVVFLLPFVVSAPVIVIPRHDLGVGPATVVVLLVLAVGALQLRHSLAAARGERPPGGVWTWLAIAALAYVPLWWFTWDWVTLQWFVAASGAMVLPRLPATIVVVGPIVGTTAVAAWYAHDAPATALEFEVSVTVYYFSGTAMGIAALCGAAWLVRVLRDLSSARTERAELAVGRERLRVSRDLHDLLGQSLSAVSLKGDLALRLLPTDTAAARAEIASLTDVARDALRDMRAVAHDEHGVSLAAELEAAAGLLGAAGVRTEVQVDLADVAGPTEQVLAWAVRESATNTLRHSEATVWRVTARRRHGRVELEIVNDGVAAGNGRGGDGDGSGLAGLRQRADALAGYVSAGATGDGRFRLRIEVPEGVS